jgi:PAS domain S-box-containing protein
MRSSLFGRVSDRPAREPIVKDNAGKKHGKGTKRKTTDDIFPKAEERCRILFEESPYGMLIMDIEGRFLEFNDAARLMLGYSREEFAQLRFSDIDLDSADEIQERRKGLFETGKTSFEAAYKTKQHGARRIRVFSRTLSAGGKELVHSIWHDVPGPAPAKKDLGDDDSKYRALFEGSPDAIFIADPDTGTILDANPAASRLVTRRREEIIGLHQSELHHPRNDQLSRKNFEQHVRETSGGGITHLTDNTIVGPDGAEVPVEILAQTVVIKGKKIIQGVFRDITERKRVDEALRTSEAFIKNILETVDEGFIVIDHDYKIVSANRAFLAQVKAPMDEVIGKHCHEVSHRSAKACYKKGEDCSVKRTFETGDPHTALHVHYDKNKDPIYTEIKSYPLKDAHGNTVSAIEIINNVTEKKKLEAQLRHSQKMEAIGQLAGGIAHDFNNILTAVTGYGSLMKAKMGKDDPLKNYLDQMLDSAKRAANLTRGLLAFSRKQPISFRPENLNRIIENIEKFLQRIIGEDIDLRVNLAERDLIVMADSGQIEQVLVNLATNAKDAMPDGGHLSISTDSVELGSEFIKAHGYGQRGSYALIVISDTGAGIDEKSRERIFEPFFTTKDVGKGTGLGLSIVYGIVKQHNGYTTCYSEPGKGTAFRIYLPRIKHQVPRRETDVNLPVMGGTETILIAEDDVTVRSLVKEILEKYGYTVIVAVDGEDAVNRFAEHRDSIKLLVLDVIMPKKNGREVYDEIRKVRPDVQVLFSSGYTADILSRKGFLKEDRQFISKPISSMDLLRRVREKLDKVPK